MTRRSELFRRMDEIERARKTSELPNFNAHLSRRAEERMKRVDSSPAEIRAVIHEIGLEIVQEFLNHGVKSARSIRYLVGVVRNEGMNGKPMFKINKNQKAKNNPINVKEKQ